MSKTILFVDDEKPILNSIKREFFDTDYNLYFALSGEEALKILSQFKNIDMVVTDMKMPNMDGYELLKNVKADYPGVIRLILSGYTDESIVFKCISNNLAKIYLTKPWEEDKLKIAINEIFKNEEILSNSNLLDLIKDVESLPTLPVILSKINTLVEDENTNINLVIDLIEQDPSISSKMLKIINSAFYGMKTASIKKAVLNLGLINLRNLIIATEIFDFEISNFHRESIWTHSNLVNKIVVEFLKEFMDKKIPDYYSTAALLHDIGKIALMKLFSDKYKDMHKIIDTNEKISFSEYEKNIFKVTHEELGACLLKWWDIPNPVVEVVLYHHTPMLSSETNREIVSVVHIVDYYVWKALCPELTPKLDENVFEYLNIKKDDCDVFMQKIQAGVIKNENQ